MEGFENLSPEEQAAMAETESGLTKKKGGGVAKNRQPQDQDRSSENGNGLSQAAAKASQNIEAFKEALQEGIEAYTDAQAQEAYQLVESTPNRFLNKLGQQCEQYSHDPDRFRGAAQAFTNRLF